MVLHLLLIFSQLLFNLVNRFVERRHQAGRRLSRDKIMFVLGRYLYRYGRALFMLDINRDFNGGQTFEKPIEPFDLSTNLLLGSFAQVSVTRGNLDLHAINSFVSQDTNMNGGTNLRPGSPFTKPPILPGEAGPHKWQAGSLPLVGMPWRLPASPRNSSSAIISLAMPFDSAPSPSRPRNQLSYNQRFSCGPNSRLLFAAEVREQRLNVAKPD